MIRGSPVVSVVEPWDARASASTWARNSGKFIRTLSSIPLGCFSKVCRPRSVIRNRPSLSGTSSIAWVSRRTAWLRWRSISISDTGGASPTESRFCFNRTTPSSTDAGLSVAILSMVSIRSASCSSGYSVNSTNSPSQLHFHLQHQNAGGRGGVPENKRAARRGGPFLTIPCSAASPGGGDALAKGVQQGADLSAAALDHGGELRALGHAHADPLDRDVDDLHGVAAMANAPVHRDRRGIRTDDLGAHDAVGVAFRTVAGDLQRLFQA